MSRDMRRDMNNSHPNKAQLKRLVFFSTMIGTAIEQYDFLLFGALAGTLFNKLFFPALSPLVSTLASVGTFAVGVAGRPIGAMVSGHFGDRMGRKSMLLIGFTLMGLASAANGILPVYASIGIWAPLLLIALRLLQGVAMGAEQTGATILAVEHAPSEARGLWGSFPVIGSYVGALMAFTSISLLSVVSGDAFETWGWRVPFLASIVLLFIGLLIRSHLPETAAFSEIEASRNTLRYPLLEVLRQHAAELLTANIITFANFGWSTIVLVVTVPFMTLYLKLPRSESLNAVAVASVVAIFITVPLIGYLSDRLGRRPLIMAAGILTALFGWPYFLLLETRNPYLIIAAVTFGFAVITPLSFAVTSSFFAEMFAANVRFSGVAMGQQVGTMLSGFTVPMFATYALARTGGNPWPIGVFCVVMGGAMALAVFLARETSGRQLSPDATILPPPLEPAKSLASQQAIKTA
jgi:MHS family shikimate/dehydroshikimate transporter-like MFS transporter